jgi:hypothetical protein
MNSIPSLGFPDVGKEAGRRLAKRRRHSKRLRTVNKDWAKLQASFHQDGYRFRREGDVSKAMATPER